MHIGAGRDVATCPHLLQHGSWSQAQEQGLRRQHSTWKLLGGLIPCAGSDLKAGSPGLEGERKTHHAYGLRGNGFLLHTWVFLSFCYCFNETKLQMVALCLWRSSRLQKCAVLVDLVSSWVFLSLSLAFAE